MSRLVSGLTILVCGITIGVIVNSVDVSVSEPFRFSNPVPINATFQQVRTTVRKQPEMQDTRYGLKFFGLQVPIVTYRTVTDPVTGQKYSGRLDMHENIHSDTGTYELRVKHDSVLYERIIPGYSNPRKTNYEEYYSNVKL